MKGGHLMHSGIKGILYALKKNSTKTIPIKYLLVLYPRIVSNALNFRDSKELYQMTFKYNRQSLSLNINCQAALHHLSILCTPHYLGILFTVNIRLGTLS